MRSILFTFVVCLMATTCQAKRDILESLFTDKQCQRIIANPLELNYRFQYGRTSRREAADPVIEYFKGKYYLFASKSGGYWSSTDLCKWDYIKCTTIDNIEGYAPSVLIHNDSIYYVGSGKEVVYRTANPDKDEWEAIETHFKKDTEAGFTDPAFFKDDDGKVYLYWVCSSKYPIVGVEVDPSDGFRAKGKSKVLIEHNADKYGWEVFGENNDEDYAGWNEGACMIKHNGKYYLHYASPGTQFRIYADGIYVGDSPLGPFKYQESNPFSIKPGGFIGGAGHGHTFQDKYGNYWHVATMKISVRDIFERRLGLFPVFFDDKGDMHAQTAWTDYPMMVPNKKVDFAHHDCSMGWNLLSYRKGIKASSSMDNHIPTYANDERVESWWAAKTGQVDEWLQIDLGEVMKVQAAQVNFADQDFNLHATNSYFNYQYIIEHSVDGNNWEILSNQGSNLADLPHDLHVLKHPIRTRYIKITNKKNMEGKFSISDFRIFGKGNGEVPQTVNKITVNRAQNDKRIIRLHWEPVAGATGYVVHWGVDKEHLLNSVVVYENDYEARYYNRDSEYFFAVDAFNENGIATSSR